MEGYTIGEIPRSEELYHHGVTGQKWYLRRYQNQDGSLTPLGREHYKVGPPRDTMGRRFITYQLNKIRARHPWMFTDDQLLQFTERERKLSTYRRAKNEADDLKRMSTGRKVVGKLLTGTGHVAGNAADKVLGLGWNLIETNIKKTNEARLNEKLEEKYPKDDKKKMRDISYLDVLNNPSNYTKKDLEIAQALYTGKLAYDKNIREENRLSSRIYREFSANYDPSQALGGYSEDEYSSFLKRIEEARIAEGLSKPGKKGDGNNGGGSGGSGESSEEKQARKEREKLERLQAERAGSQGEHDSSPKDYSNYGGSNNYDPSSSELTRRTPGIPEPDSNYSTVLKLKNYGYKWPDNRGNDDPIFVTLPGIGAVPLKSIQTSSDPDVREFLREYYPENI